MSSIENTNQILEEAIFPNPQLTEAPEKKRENGLWTWVKANKKPILAVMGVAALAGVAYGIGSKKLVVELPGLHKEAVKHLPKKTVDAAPIVQTEPIREKLETMTRKEFCHRVADFNEALFDLENELDEVRFKIKWEDDPERKAWFVAAQERLLRAKDETEEELMQFTAENRAVFWTADQTQLA